MQYATWRPRYPAALFETIAAALCSDPASARVWEPACGSGQATIDLAERFGPVFATEPSAAQLDAHPASLAHDARITLAVESAEACSLQDSSVDLVAVAQALHWFEQDRFFEECRRVLMPKGVLAAWCYQDFLAPAGMQDAVAEFRFDIDPHWPPQREDIISGYGRYRWPFADVASHDLELTQDWTLPHLLGYLSSLSATTRANASCGKDPVQMHASALTDAWGDETATRRVVWPLRLVMCQS